MGRFDWKSVNILVVMLVTMVGIIDYEMVTVIIYCPKNHTENQLPDSTKSPYTINCVNEWKEQTRCDDWLRRGKEYW